MPVDLDHNATSPMHPEVVDAILPFLHHSPANPSSLHSYGRMSRSAVDTARAQLGRVVALNAVRVSFGMNNSLQDVDALFTKLQELINKLPAVIRQAAV